jgi:pyrimidine-specific ribonucleoside hydrolase
MKRLICILSVFTISLMTIAHPWKPNNYVIVDTDGGLDDFRALCLLLSSPDIRILAIVTSDGVLEADSAYRKVKSLLTDLHHEGLPVGVFSSDSTSGKNCPAAVNFEWGRRVPVPEFCPGADEVIASVMNQTEERVTFIAMGSLAFTAGYLNNSGAAIRKIRQIIWSNGSSLGNSEFNYALSPWSYSVLGKQKMIPFHWIDPSGQEEFFSEDLKERIAQIPGQYSQNITRSLKNQDSPYGKIFFDEALVVYLHDPLLFSADTLEGVICNKISGGEKVNDKVVSILDGSCVNQNQVLKAFPMEKEFYQEDVGRIRDDALYAFGKDEWIAGVMANEMHRHLGAYAIVGVKMGMRARDYFLAGVDEMQVVSFAGTNPPFSCMNDGLQISTGATLGHGLIKVDQEEEKLPAANFTYMGRTITISLKKEYRLNIESRVRELTIIHGINSNVYWELLREAAINYWAGWDRNEIFEIREIH